jgi:photosystem II stability/assembly factor-like uncharacterized protein
MSFCFARTLLISLIWVVLFVIFDSLTIAATSFMRIRGLVLLVLLSQAVFGQQIVWKNTTPALTASFRGLSVINNNVAWVGGSKGWFGRSVDGGEHWAMNQVKGKETLDFRSVYAFSAKTAVIANAGSPAYILRTTDGGNTWKEVYKTTDTAAFFDGITFWNDTDGVVYGDPFKGRLTLLYTTDGGKTWQPEVAHKCPELMEGEASFAASGTAIRSDRTGKIIIATGGTRSRLLITAHRGGKWKVLEPPILHGESSQGIFSVACKDDYNMVIVGGDYKQESLAKNNVFYTRDCGKTWNAPLITTGGYRECAEYIDEHTLIATGPTGTDVSTDGGITWRSLSYQKNCHVVRKARLGSLVVIAGGNGSIGIIK